MSLLVINDIDFLHPPWPSKGEDDQDAIQKNTSKAQFRSKSGIELDEWRKYDTKIKMNSVIFETVDM